MLPGLFLVFLWFGFFLFCCLILFFCLWRAIRVLVVVLFCCGLVCVCVMFCLYALSFFLVSISFCGFSVLGCVGVVFGGFVAWCFWFSCCWWVSSLFVVFVFLICLVHVLFVFCCVCRCFFCLFLRLVDGLVFVFSVGLFFLVL